MTNYNKSKICKTANTLVKKGYNKSDAFRKAWELAKSIISKVAGITFGKRPRALARLTRYSKDNISVHLIREYRNVADSGAIAVMATVEGKGSYQVGYIPADVAKILSPVMDIGTEVKAIFNEIVGGFMNGINYGMRISLGI